MNTVFANGRYQIVLDDGTVISDPAYHCLCPFQVNGCVLMALCGPNNKIRARKLATNQNLDIQIAGTGGAIEWASDGRYVVGAQRINQGKQFGVLDIIAVIFDTQAAQWSTFSANTFWPVAGQRQPNALWIKNGRQNSNFPGTDPSGPVGIPFFPNPGLIRFTINRVWYERTIDPATGALGPLEVAP